MAGARGKMRRPGRDNRRRRQPPPKDRPQVHLWLADEAPRLGCGLRLVEIAKYGRVWVHLIYRPGGRRGPAIRQRLRREVFRQVAVDMKGEIE